MYSCISGRLAAQDQDQEVKEAAILGMAALIAQLGDVLKDEVRQECLIRLMSGVISSQHSVTMYTQPAALYALNINPYLNVVSVYDSTCMSQPQLTKTHVLSGLE